MNPVDIKIEKANAIYQYNNKLQRFTTLFRFIEIIIFIIVIFRLLSTQLPFNIKVSIDHLKGISFSGFISSKYVFVLGNTIILILLLKSRAVENRDHNDKIIDVYDEYVKSCEKRVVNNSIINFSTCATTNSVVSSNDERKICRSQSENMMKVVKCQDSRGYKKLRRSVTDKKIVKNVDGGGGERVVVSKDELSSDEFRRTVEAFIARQQQSLRDEELAPVPYIGT